MKDVNSILVVVNRSADSGFVLEKAAAVASTTPGGARVNVIRVIHEPLIDNGRLSADEAQRLKLYLMQAEEEYLVDLVRPHRKSFASLECATLWNKRNSDAVVQAAEELDADLVIKATDGDGPHFLRHPDDWNLMRHARRPVMLVKPIAWVEDPVILAAVDALDTEHADLTARILVESVALTAALNGRLHVTSAYPNTAPWSADPNVVLDFDRLRRDLEKEVRGNLERLCEAAGAVPRRMHLAEGQPIEVVAEAADASAAEVLVIGTLGREGVRGLVIGNTSEKLLNQVACDVLVMHA